MKLIIICVAVLFSFASGTFYDALVDQAPRDVVSEFWVGMGQAPSLALIHPEFPEEAKEIEEDVKSQMALTLKEVLEDVFKKIHDGLEKAKNFKQGIMNKVAEMVQKLKEMTGKSEELRERIRERIEVLLRALFETLSLGSQSYELVRVPLILDKRSLMEVVKQKILEKLNLKDLIEYVKSKLAKLGEVGLALLEALQRPNALNLLKDLIYALLPGQSPEYGIADIWNKVKDFFKDLGVKISDKFFLFANWLKDVSQKGWEKISDKTGKLKEMAKTVLEKGSSMSKKVAQQALEFFKEHKSEIGEVLWSLVKGALTKAIISAG